MASQQGGLGTVADCRRVYLGRDLRASRRKASAPRLAIPTREKRRSLADETFRSIWRQRCLRSSRRNRCTHTPTLPQRLRDAAFTWLTERQWVRIGPLDKTVKGKRLMLLAMKAGTMNCEVLASPAGVGGAW